MIPKFQPILDVCTQTNLGYEAFIRGEHGESAQELFQQAKLSKTLIELDSAARDISIRQGLTILKGEEKLFVNITKESLRQTCKWFESGVPFHKIVLEISEGTPFSHILNIKEYLQEYCEKGMEVALDDYGRGFHNLESFVKLPLTYIKLDKMFAAEIQKAKVAEIVKFFSRMCQDTKYKLIVEGIETEDQKERMLDLGIRYMQGFHFSFPKTLSEFHLTSPNPLSI